MEEVIALSKENERQFKRKVNKTKLKVAKGQLILKNDPDVIKHLKKKLDKNDTIPKIDVKSARLKKPKPERGLIYVGHIPHGFYETQMQAFFKQFGTVTNCRVNRSAKTGASKGFGYIEFKNPEVAQIAAETMNNYLMFKRRLITKYIPASEQKINLFRAAGWSKTNFPMKESRNDTTRIYNNNTYINYEDECRGMIKSVQIKLDKLSKLGITYDFKFNDVPDFLSAKEGAVSEETTSVVEGAEVQKKSKKFSTVNKRNAK